MLRIPKLMPTQRDGTSVIVSDCLESNVEDFNIINNKTTTDNTQNEAHIYLQQIAKTPLLTSQEESELFQKFQIYRKRIVTIYDDLPVKIKLKTLFNLRGKRRGSHRKTGDYYLNSVGIQQLINNISEEIAFVSCQINSTGNEAHLTQHPSVEGAMWTQQQMEVAQLQRLLLELREASKNMHDVKQKLVECNLLLVASVAKRHNFKSSPLSFLDLMQEGSIGLMHAVDKFDLQRGYRFSTYATWWIMQAIRRAIEQQSQTIRAPCYIGEMRRRINRMSSKLSRQLQREPTLNEIAEHVGMSEKRILEILRSDKDTISLDTPLNEAISDTTIADVLPDDVNPSPEEEVLDKAQTEGIEQILSTLTAREAHVIKMRFGLVDGIEYTLSEIGKQLGISRERVRQIEEETLKKLRHPTRSEYLEEFL